MNINNQNTTGGVRLSEGGQYRRGHNCFGDEEYPEAEPPSKFVQGPVGPSARHDSGQCELDSCIFCAEEEISPEAQAMIDEIDSGNRSSIDPFAVDFIDEDPDSKPITRREVSAFDDE